MASIESIAFTKLKMDQLRDRIKEVRDKLNAHIGEGGSIHPIATVSNNGFMSSAQFATYISLISPGKDSSGKDLDSPEMVRLKALMAANTLPSGTTLWYCGTLSDLATYYPDWELTEAKTTNPLYQLTQQVGGGELRGTALEDEDPGTIETNYAKSSGINPTTQQPRMKTVALWSIRKK